VRIERGPSRQSCRWLWFSLGMLALLVGSVVSCLRVAEERAERDLRVGRARGHGLTLNVAEGHAASLLLNPGELRLWGSTPAFELTLARTEDTPDEVVITIHNLMPAAELRHTFGGGVVIGEPVRHSETRASWSLRLLSTEPAQLMVAPPDAGELEVFEFALLSDVQEAIGGFHEMIARVNEESEIRFVLGAGDLTSDGTRAQLERFQRELVALRVPYYATLGNHELGVDPPVYHDLFGRGNYSFVFRGVRFTMLDSASATLDPLVHDWLGHWLDQGRAETHIVSMHIPPLDPSGTRHGAFASKNEAAKLLNQLALHGVDLTLYGHIHTYIRFDNAGIEAHIAGGGGAIPNRGDGIGRHYLVVRADARQGILGTRVVEVDSDWDF
jgi:3',5'-cyclic-AMP phosphodiesterase